VTSGDTRTVRPQRPRTFGCARNRSCCWGATGKRLLRIIQCESWDDIQSAPRWALSRS